MFNDYCPKLFSQLFCSIALQAILVALYISVKYKLSGLRPFSRTISAHLLGIFAVGIVLPLIVGSFLWFLSPAVIPGALSVMLYVTATFGLPGAVGDIIFIPRLHKFTLSTIDGVGLLLANYLASITTNIVFHYLNQV